jgi:endonuclease/exonuclease/phosphatase family metal-dependent hydrolase
MTGTRRLNLRLVSFFVLIALAIGLSGCLFSKADSDASAFVPVKVMSYNIHGGRGGPKEGAPALEGLERVARIVEKHCPDLLLIQEIERGAERSQKVDEILWLQQRLGYTKSAFAPGIVEGEWNYGVAIFSNYPGKITATKHPLFLAGEPGKYAEQRVVLESTIQIEGVPVRVFCTHLGLSPEERKKQTADILEIMSRGEGPAILAGEFNAEPGSPEMKPREEKMTDVLCRLWEFQGRERAFVLSGGTPGDGSDRWDFRNFRFRTGSGRSDCRYDFRFGP